VFVPVTDIRKIAELFVAQLLWYKNHANGECTYCEYFGHNTADCLIDSWVRDLSGHLQSGVYGYVTEE